MTSWTVEIPELPGSIDEYVALRDTLAQTPQGGAAMMVLALHAYAQDEALGRACLTLAVDRDLLVQGPDGYRGWELRSRDMSMIRRQIQGRPYVPQSYFEGTSPGTRYRLGAPPYTIACSDNPYSGDRDVGPFKVFVACSGSASPRPVTVKRNDRGIWKAYEWSSLLVGVATPLDRANDDL